MSAAAFGAASVIRIHGSVHVGRGVCVRSPRRPLPHRCAIRSACFAPTGEVGDVMVFAR